MLSIGDFSNKTELPWVRIGIVNYNSGGMLKTCLEHLMQQTDSKFEVVIVDNKSTDGSADCVNGLDPKIRLIQASCNLGFAGGSNLALAGASSPWVATLNPDAFPNQDWLASIAACINRWPDATMIGSTQLDANNPGFYDGAGDCLSIFGFPWRGDQGRPIDSARDDFEVFGPCGAAAFYSTADFERVQGFDESFFCYCEDVDLAFRLRHIGGYCVQSSRAFVRHVGSASTGRQSHFTIYHSARNRLWVLVKNMPDMLLPIAVLLHFILILYMSLALSRAKIFKPTILGLKDAIFSLPYVWSLRRQLMKKSSVKIFTLARSLTWSLALMADRRIDSRPLPRRR